MGQAASGAASQGATSYSAVVDEGSPETGVGATYRSEAHKAALVNSFAADVVTLGDLFERAVRLYPGRPFLGRITAERTMQYQSYYMVSRRVKLFSSGLLLLAPGGAFPQRVGLLAVTCPESVLVSESCNVYGATLVTLHESFDDAILLAALEAVPCQVMAVSQARVPALLDVLSRVKARTTHTVVQLSGVVSDAHRTLAETRSGAKLVSLAEVEATGLSKPMPAARSNDADSTAVVTFSSGSTGTPRAVALSHRNFVAALTGAYVALWRGAAQGDDVHAAYLPFPFIFERLLHYCFMVTGGQLGFTSGAVEKLFEDLAIVRPTVLIAVPRLFSIMQEKVRERKCVCATLYIVVTELGRRCCWS